MAVLRKKKLRKRGRDGKKKALEAVGSKGLLMTRLLRRIGFLKTSSGCVCVNFGCIHANLYSRPLFKMPNGLTRRIKSDDKEEDSLIINVVAAAFVNMRKSQNRPSALYGIPNMRCR